MAEECKVAFDQAIELRVATPTMVLSYCEWLQEPEDRFKALERALEMF